jgi:NAD(P)-dependent dehydrogenase (short-subunit alcohol dehydrogenase family)
MSAGWPIGHAADGQLATLAGRHALVTGGGSGIGAAVAQALAGAGARLTLVGRDQARLEARASSLADARAVVCDVTDEEAVTRVCEEAGPVDVLVNNAGVASAAPLARTSLAELRRLLDVNVVGAFQCCRELVPGMRERGFGRVVNVASIAGLQGAPYISAYTASKHALVGITRSLAREVVRDGVTVNAVCPAYTETAILEQAVRGVVEATGRDPVEARRAILAEVSQQRAVTPEEVASAVLWLSLPQQGAITGEALVISGGDLA